MTRNRLHAGRASRLAALGACLLALAAPAGEALAAITVSKSIEPGFPGTILPGDPTRFRVTLSNDNAVSAVANVAFTDDMTAPGIRVVSGVSNTCGGTLTANPGDTAFSLAGATIPVAPGGGTLGSCDLVVEVTSTVTGVRTNIIPAGAVTGDDGTPIANAQQAVQTITVLTLLNPTISKSFAPTTLVQGGATSLLTINIVNPNAGATIPLTTVTDNLPAGLRVAAVPNASAACSGAGAVDGTFAPAAGDLTLTFTGGTVGQSGSCQLRVNVEATSAGPTGSQVLTNTLLAADVGNTRGLTPPANATANITVNSPLRVTKSFSPNPAAAGQQGTLTITLSNDRPAGAIALTTFSDEPIGSPPGIVVSAAPATTCAGGAVAATAGNTGVTLTGGSIPAGGNCAITVPFTATLPVPGTPQTFTNDIAAGDVGNAEGLVNRAVTATVVVNDQLTVAKTVTPANVAPGNPVNYTITVRNFTASPRSAVSFTDNLPGGLTALAAPAPAISAGCGNFSANLATPAAPVFTFDMPAGAGANPGVCTISFSAMVPAGAGVGSTAGNVIPAGAVSDGLVSNPGASNTVTNAVIDTAPFTKAFNPTNLSEGSLSQFTITFSNNSANPLTIIDLTDALPSAGGGQVVVGNPANASSTCAGATLTAVPGNPSVRIQNGTVPARAGGGTGAAGTCVLRVNVTGPSGIYTNTIPANTLQASGTVAGVPNQPVTYPNPVTAPITFNSALTAAKSFAPTVIQAGGRSRVTIRLGNAGTGTLNDVAVTDPLPAGDMNVASPPNALTTCGGSPVITAVPGAASASLAGAVIPSGGQCDFQFEVISASGGASVNTIPVGNVTAAGGVRNTTPVTATLTKSAGGVVATKSVSPNTVTAPGQAVTLTITLLNTGPVALSGVAVNDSFTTTGQPGAPLTGMRVAATPNAATTCPGGIVTAPVNATAVVLTGANLAAAGSAGDSCTVTVDVTTVTVGTVQNTIPAGAVTSTQGVSNSGTAVTSLAALGRLGVQKAFVPPTVQPGQRSRMVLRFLNPLALPLANLSVTDNLPAGVVVPPGANPTTTCVGATISTPTPTQVVVTGGTLPAASLGGTTSCDVGIDVVAAAPGAYVNVIADGTVTATAGGVPISNPPPPTTATLQVRSPASVAKSFSPNPARTGQPSTLTIVITNPNTIALSGAVLTDNLPSGVAVAPVPNAATTCGGATVNLLAPASATSVTLTGATVPAGGSCQIRVDTVSNTAGSYPNTIPANALATAEGVGNAEPANATLVVSNPPTVAKQFVPASIPAGGIATLTIALGNANAGPATLSANLDDNLPGGIVVAAPNGLATTCPGAVTAVAGSALVRYPSGAQIPAGGCSIGVNVTGAVQGSYNNFIPAAALQTNLGSNLQPANAALAISPLGFVSGRVFRDNNLVPNGSFESGTDTPISGVAITLTGTDFGADGVAGGGDDTPVSFSTTTDALGNYAFTGLNAGSYTVTEPTQPPGTNNGVTTAGAVAGGGGGSPGTATPVGVTPSAVATIVLLRNAGGQVANSAGNNFAEVAPSSISGRVFVDENNNGVQNGGDAGLAGVTIELLDAGGNVIATTLTDANGDYSFTGLAPGTYSVREPAQPPNTSNGITTAGAVPNGGTPGTASAPNVLPSRITGIVLPPNTAASGNNFAEVPNGRTLSGSVFLDFNGNGAIDGSDHGIGGQTIELTGTDINGNPVSRTATTAPDGSYTFAGLPAGTYTVTQPNQPAGTANGQTVPGSTGGAGTAVGVTPSAISGIDLTGANTVSANNDFAELPGAAPDLAIAKTHAPVTFAEGGNTGFYTISPRNIGTVATAGTVTVTDTLPLGMTLAANPGDASWSCASAVNGGGQTVVTCTTNTAIPPNATGPPITVRVAVGAGLAGQVLVNSAVIAGGGEPPGFDGNNTATDPTAVAQAASVSGAVWRDADHDRVRGAGEPMVPGFIVELLLNGVPVASTTTDANGAYSFGGLAPGPGYRIRFREPGSGAVYGYPVPNEQGVPFTNGVVGPGNPAGATNADGTLAGLTLQAGVNIAQQSLPLDPSGVVYDSVTRSAVAGAVVAIAGPPGFDPAVHLVGGAGNASQTTGVSGFYQFLLLPGAPPGNYTIATTAPAGYLPAPSGLVPPCTAPVAVGAAPDPALVQASNTAPAAAVPAHNPAACPGIVAGGSNTTQYFTSFNLVPGVSANVLNNHIPLDPILGGALVLTKTTPLVNVARGDLVPYTVTATNALAAALPNIDIRDRIPPGFRYRAGSATLNGLPLEPVVNGRELTWAAQTFAPGERKTIKLVLVVGSGVGDGEYVNEALALNRIVGAQVSNLATAAVRVVPDPTFDCSDLIGKVFDDANANGWQDDGERGIPGVRIATARGLLVTTDAEGRFHVACAAIPQADRGSNFVMKLDERTLPSGYRLTTENPRDVRVTRGKMVKLDFGATIHRVVRIDVSGAAFEPDGTGLRPDWQRRIESLPGQLIDRPSVVRIAYRREGESADLAQARVQALRASIQRLWDARKCCYPLAIEVEEAPR